MTNTLDMRNMSFESANRTAVAFVTAKLIESLADVIYRVARCEQVVEVNEPGWQLSLRLEPSLRVMVRIGDEKLHKAACNALRALEFQVRDKGDHLVVII